MSHTFATELYSDLHKDAFGFRPTSLQRNEWAAKSDDEKQKEWDYMVTTMAVNEAQERLAEERAVAKVEDEISNLIEFGKAADRKEAIALIAARHEVNGDLEYLCFRLGVKYGYFDRNVVQ